MAQGHARACEVRGQLAITIFMAEMMGGELMEDGGGRGERG